MESGTPESTVASNWEEPDVSFNVGSVLPQPETRRFPLRLPLVTQVKAN